MGILMTRVIMLVIAPPERLDLAAKWRWHGRYEDKAVLSQIRFEALKEHAYISNTRIQVAVCLSEHCYFPNITNPQCR